jgi:CheY-like chemotaxis protein
VQSQPGQGTNVTVYLPLIAKPPMIKVDSRGTQPNYTGTEHILVVDDEEPIVRLERQMLERLGYRTTSRVSAVDALEAFKSNPDAYDMVITDMTMPNMTGDRLAKELMKIRPNIPVIICTGFSERINQEKAAHLGIKGFLMKPVVRSDLAGMIREVLDTATDAD